MNDYKFRARHVFYGRYRRYLACTEYETRETELFIAFKMWELFELVTIATETRLGCSRLIMSFTLKPFDSLEKTWKKLVINGNNHEPRTVAAIHKTLETLANRLKTLLAHFAKTVHISFCNGVTSAAHDFCNFVQLHTASTNSSKDAAYKGVCLKKFKRSIMRKRLDEKNCSFANDHDTEKYLGPA